MDGVCRGHSLHGAAGTVEGQDRGGEAEWTVQPGNKEVSWHTSAHLHFNVQVSGLAGGNGDARIPHDNVK